MKSVGQATDWSKAYSRYRPDILDFLRRRLWSRPDLAEDLAQETFAHAMNAGEPIRDPSRTRAYLRQIANNLVISHIRKRSRVSMESDLGSSVNLELYADREAVDPLAASEVAQFREKVERLVSQLPDDQQIAFNRGVLERIPYTDIAEENGWTVVKVKSCVFRARKTLMAFLDDFR